MRTAEGRVLRRYGGHGREMRGLALVTGLPLAPLGLQAVFDGVPVIVVVAVPAGLALLLVFLYGMNRLGATVVSEGGIAMRLFFRTRVLTWPQVTQIHHANWAPEAVFVCFRGWGRPQMMAVPRISESAGNDIVAEADFLREVWITEADGCWEPDPAVERLLKEHEETVFSPLFIATSVAGFLHCAMAIAMAVAFLAVEGGPPAWAETHLLVTVPAALFVLVLTVLRIRRYRRLRY